MDKSTVLQSMTSSLSNLRPEVVNLKRVLDDFVENECIPAESEYDTHLKDRYGAARWTIDAIPPCMERLKARAKKLGLWNLFIPPKLIPAVRQLDANLAPKISLSYREYAILCESLGRCPHIAPEACNCSAPDTGNMEVLLEFGSDLQKQKYLLPLLRGDIRSAFLMTEPNVASSDPTNLQTRLDKTANGYVLNGRKWWSTGAMDPRCGFVLVVARSPGNSANPHNAHTIVLVPCPHGGIELMRPLTVMGYDDAPIGHAEVKLSNIHLDSSCLILGEGSGFRVAQARLGPGRIHHCMRAIGMASRAYEMMLQRSLSRKTFGKYLYQHGSLQENIADSATSLEAARLMTLSCASLMDDVGVKAARLQIAMIKVAVPKLTYEIVDRAVQVFGGAGLYHSFLAKCLAGLRSLRIADGPDAVHKRTIARLEIKKVCSRL